MTCRLLMILIACGSCLHSGAGTPEGYGPRAAANEVNGGVNHVAYVCPAGFVRSGNSCYYLSSTMATWQDAHFECKDRGAELARMEKRYEDKNMRIYLNRPELAPLERWIGGIYNWESRKWVWGATAKPLGYQGFSRRKLYDNNKWHCIVMDPRMMYRWAPRSCVRSKHYICEKRLKIQRKKPAPDNKDPQALKQRGDKWKKNRKTRLEKKLRREELVRERVAREIYISVQ